MTEEQVSAARQELVKQGRDHEIEFYETEHVKLFDLSEEYKQQCMTVLDSERAVPEFWRQKYFNEKVKNWDLFYNNVKDKFWKDRSWLLREFPPLSPFFKWDPSKYDARDPLSIMSEDVLVEDKRIMLEVGCGTGSSIYPAIARNPFLEAYGFDCSPKAVMSLKQRWHQIQQGPLPEAPTAAGWYDDEGRWKGGSLLGGTVWDISEDLIAEEILVNRRREIDIENGVATVPGTFADVVCLIFCLSALPVYQQTEAAKRVTDLIVPGGHLCFRDYGRYDELQLKFAKSETAKQVDPNSYVRGDNTLQYYWTLSEVDRLFTEHCGLERVKSEYILREFKNRKTGQILKRVWVQGIYRSRLAEQPVGVFTTPSQAVKENYSSVHNEFVPAYNEHIVNGVDVTPISKTPRGQELKKLNLDSYVKEARIFPEVKGTPEKVYQELLFRVDYTLDDAIGDVADHFATHRMRRDLIGIAIQRGKLKTLITEAENTINEMSQLVEKMIMGDREKRQGVEELRRRLSQKSDDLDQMMRHYMSNVNESRNSKPLSMAEEPRVESVGLFETRSQAVAQSSGSK
eukprot:GHVH01017135.1.p1 GENE.GHVH01017135.1~~GHVH01017135.1.p1  ORF type:complete len:571 (-),score=86.14 GHVH01017135.1:468-2180(-)